MATLAHARPAAAPASRARVSRDDWLVRALAVVIGLYLVWRARPAALRDAVEVVLDLPASTWARSRSRAATTTLGARSGAFRSWTTARGRPFNFGLTPTARTRLQATEIIAPADLEGSCSPCACAICRRRRRPPAPRCPLLRAGRRVRGRADGSPPDPGPAGAGFASLANYAAYFATPALSQSIWNSLLIVSLISAVVTICLAFVYRLWRSPAAACRSRGCSAASPCCRSWCPRCCPGIALVYLFGNQGMIEGRADGPRSIYGPIGIVIGSVFFTLPARLPHHLDGAGDLRRATLRGGDLAAREPAADLLDRDAAGRQLRADLGGLRGLHPGDHRFRRAQGDRRRSSTCSPLDIYKQVIGQQNFEMGAVVCVILLLPAVVAFVVDRLVQRRQVATALGPRRAL